MPKSRFARRSAPRSMGGRGRSVSFYTFRKGDMPYYPRPRRTKRWSRPGKSWRFSPAAQRQRWPLAEDVDTPGMVGVVWHREQRRLLSQRLVPLTPWGARRGAHGERRRGGEPAGVRRAGSRAGVVPQLRPTRRWRRRATRSVFCCRPKSVGSGPHLSFGVRLFHTR